MSSLVDRSAAWNKPKYPDFFKDELARKNAFLIVQSWIIPARCNSRLFEEFFQIHFRSSLSLQTDPIYVSQIYSFGSILHMFFSSSWAATRNPLYKILVVDWVISHSYHGNPSGCLDTCQVSEPSTMPDMRTDVGPMSNHSKRWWDKRRRRKEHDEIL